MDENYWLKDKEYQRILIFIIILLLFVQWARLDRITDRYDFYEPTFVQD